jgi:hypothetical protein
LDQGFGSDDSRSATHTELLYVYSAISTALQHNIDAAIGGALASGANYAQVAKPLGVSRQAVRQRWERHLRHSKPRLVRLVGGPHDGKSDIAFGNLPLLRAVDDAPWVDPYFDEEIDLPAEVAKYVCSKTDQWKYVFVGVFDRSEDI